MTQNNKKPPKKSLLSTLGVIVVALLLFLAQQMGLLPAQEAEVLPTDAAMTETVAVTDAPTEAITVTEAPTEAPTKAPTEAPTEAVAIIEPQAIVNYLATHNGKLPDNFITKNEAQALGWDSAKNYLSDVAPGKSIGGDRFGNYEGLLPTASGRQYHEADCYYTGGKRNAYRLVYSNDGHYYYTEDHYNTFTELFPE